MTCNDTFPVPVPYGSDGSQQPVLGLPASQDNYIYATQFYGAFCTFPPPPSDTVTLTCSDPSNGTVAQTLTLTPTPASTPYAFCGE